MTAYNRSTRACLATVALLSALSLTACGPGPDSSSSDAAPAGAEETGCPTSYPSIPSERSWLLLKGDQQDMLRVCSNEASPGERLEGELSSLAPPFTYLRIGFAPGEMSIPAEKKEQADSVTDGMDDLLVRAALGKLPQGTVLLPPSKRYPASWDAGARLDVTVDRKATALLVLVHALHHGLVEKLTARADGMAPLEAEERVLGGGMNIVECAKGVVEMPGIVDESDPVDAVALMEKLSELSDARSACQAAVRSVLGTDEPVREVVRPAIEEAREAPAGVPEAPEHRGGVGGHLHPGVEPRQQVWREWFRDLAKKSPEVAKKWSGRLKKW
ncbi:hypothetical protein ACFVJI_22255 [Streptomyces sp. NPDC127584]|uniref:hypothetical protein n=1 Tax=Streptomyces sp. NPDC127584 TaxID=3345403 RepID=UPI00363F2284